MTTQQLTDVPVIKEVTINAPAAKVWEAITDKDKMKEWYFDIADFKPEVGFQFEFTGTDKDCVEYKHICTITEVVPGKKLVHTWTYADVPGLSHVTWELFEEGDTTRLQLTHTGLNTFDQSKPSFRRESFDGGWTHIVQKSIKEYLEKNA